MQSSHRVPDVRTWGLLVLAGCLLLSGAIGPSAQTPQRAGIVQALETYDGTPVGFTTDGHPFRGKPDAPVTVVEYTDYVCPFCQRHFSMTLPTLLETYVRTGKVRYVLHDFPLDSLHPMAPAIANAAACVAEQGAARFWQMHDALFKAQQQLSGSLEPGAVLTATARTIGADVPAYQECMTSGRHKASVQQSAAEAQKLGFTGTPTFQFLPKAGGKTYTMSGALPAKAFAEWIDALLEGKQPPEDKQTAKPELPSWAKPDQLAPDPRRPGYTLAGDPYKGKAGAKLIVVEFADFECPSCRRHALDTQPELDARLVETGEVMWVAKPFPLGIHPRAPIAAAAAVCAGEQGRYWDMHHALFDGVDRWSHASDPDATLLQIASTLGLDRAKFSTCLASRRSLEPVLRGIYDGQSIGIKSSPTFIFVKGDTISGIAGTRPADQFESLLKQQLDGPKAVARAQGAGGH